VPDSNSSKYSQRVFESITQSSLFIFSPGNIPSSIIVNKDFMNQFDAETQEIMATAAFNAARKERRESVADIPNILAQCEAEGVEVVKMSAEEESKFKSITSKVYDMYANYFSPGLVSKLQAA
jgi:TRAP-type C4-dicarboxylate transport system substrate-binding protein